MAGRNLSQDPEAAVRVATQRLDNMMNQYIDIVPQQLSLAMAQMLDAVRADQEQRHIRATLPPTGPNGPNAAGGRDQD
eukprot:12180360-Prorocentrum_lima.AAC.1